MKTAVYYSNADVRVEDRPVPRPGRGEYLLKIEASVTNAQAYLAIPDFSAYLWGFMDGVPLNNRLRSMKRSATSVTLPDRTPKSPSTAAHKAPLWSSIRRRRPGPEERPVPHQ